MKELIQRLREGSRQYPPKQPWWMYRREMGEAADALERMQWIPVSERLPERYDRYGRLARVLAASSMGTVHLEWASHIIELTDAAKEEGDTVFFTHWRPEPDPPAIDETRKVTAALDHEQPARIDIGSGDA